MDSKHIVILTHEAATGFESSSYYLRVFTEIWRDQGHQVSVARGVDRLIPGDVVIVHVDLTEVSAKYLKYASQYPVAINGKVKTIAKDSFSVNLLHQSSNYRGKVIVKTRANYGGIHEAELRHKSGYFQAGLGVDERPWRKVEYMNPHNYPIFNSTADVPPGVWRNPRLIVEKFLPETDEAGRYYARCWYFFGETNFHCHLMSKNPTVKEAADDEEERFALESLNDSEFQAQPVPQELQDLRRKMGIDYGMMDWGLHDGRVVIYDVNKTPTLSKDLADDEEYMAMEKVWSLPLAARLWDFL